MKVGILNAYHFDKTPGIYQEQYMPMFYDILKEYWPEAKVIEYKVAQGELPKDLNQCQLWIITGSPMSAYDSDEWVRNLKDLIVKSDQTKTKLLGLCFGHQIIAEALGGKVEKSDRGWGVGVRKFSIIKSTKWMQPELKECSLLFSHQDQVVKLPPSAQLLAEDDFCPYQMFNIGEHIFCMQGHPEFTPEYARQRLDTRIERVGQEKYEAACKTLNNPTTAHEVWQWIKQFAK